jgi:hypothetical protein
VQWQRQIEDTSRDPAPTARAPGPIFFSQTAIIFTNGRYAFILLHKLHNPALSPYQHRYCTYLLY